MQLKGIIILLWISLLLTACGGDSSWDMKEEAIVASDRLMEDMVEVEWVVEEKASLSNGKRRIRLHINKEDGVPVEHFDINHEKLLHLMIISKDLSYFTHIHPEYIGEGVFEIYNDFPSGGEYRLIADFKPARGDSMTKMSWVSIDGQAAQPAPIAADTELVKQADGKRVSLEMSEYAADQETVLTFTITDEESKLPITDLEPYLGAIGHVVVLSEDGERYVHVHAEEGQSTGPDAVFETTFPKEGLYKIWGQFQHKGTVFTVSYVVNIAS